VDPVFYNDDKTHLFAYWAVSILFYFL